MTIKRILMTGATGLLGNRICHFLDPRQFEVILLTRSMAFSGNLPKNFTVIPADLFENLSLNKNVIGHVDIVIHLAQASGHSDLLNSASKMVSVSLNALCQLAEFACSIGAKQFILASSGGIYGGAKEKFDESASIGNPELLSFYLSVKAAAENLLKYFDQYLNINILRYFFIYGPGQKSEMLLPRMRDSILQEKEIVLSSEEGPYLNPIYVDDAAKATLACLADKKPKIINIAGNEIRSLKKICEFMGTILNITPKFVIKDNVGTNSNGSNGGINYIGNNDLMCKELHAPEIGLEEGLKTFLKYAK